MRQVKEVKGHRDNGFKFAKLSNPAHTTYKIPHQVRLPLMICVQGSHDRCIWLFLFPFEADFEGADLSKKKKLLGANASKNDMECMVEVEPYANSRNPHKVLKCI